jgi:hypothetical protein
MRNEKIELDKRELRLINNLLDSSAPNVTERFNALCRQILTRKGVGDPKPPFEVLITAGGHTTKLIYSV